MAGGYAPLNSDVDESGGRAEREGEEMFSRGLYHDHLMDRSMHQHQMTSRINSASYGHETATFHCPICLQYSQLPIRQDCGHVLCAHCARQGMSVIGGCPLCRTHQAFTGHGNPATTMEMMSMGYPSSYVQAPITSASMPASYASTLLHDGSRQYPASPHLNSNTAIMGYDGASYHRSHPMIHIDASELPLPLDSFNDFSDMIDLADLMGSDGEASRHVPTIPPRGYPRKPRAVPKKVATTKAQTANGSANSKQVIVKTPPVAGKKRKSRAVDVVEEGMVWSEIEVTGSPPSERYDCGFTIYGSKLIVVGGIVGKNRLNDLYVLDLKQVPPRWIQPPLSGIPPPTGSLLQTFVIGDILYVIGGTIDGKFLTELHAINLKAEDWKWERVEVAGTPPSMRYWYSVAVLGDLAILYGGYSHPRRLGDTFALRFDKAIPTWVELDPRGDLPGPCTTHSVCVHDAKMYIFGGYDGKSRRGQLYSFEIESKTSDTVSCVWTQLHPLGKGPSPRYTHSSAIIGSKMIIYGGNSGCLKGDVYILELDGDIATWKLAKCDQAPLAREWHRVVVYNGAMYVFGGHTSTGNDNKLFCLATVSPQLAPSAQG